MLHATHAKVERWTAAVSNWAMPRRSPMLTLARLDVIEVEFLSLPVLLFFALS
jgi:hypothetical protein